MRHLRLDDGVFVGEEIMQRVSSSAIDYVDYNEATAELQIAFHRTGLYTYYGVPHQVYDAFLHASSKGRFFNDNIRDRYSARR